CGGGFPPCSPRSTDAGSAGANPSIWHLVCCSGSAIWHPRNTCRKTTFPASGCSAWSTARKAPPTAKSSTTSYPCRWCCCGKTGLPRGKRPKKRCPTPKKRGQRSGASLKTSHKLGEPSPDPVQGTVHENSSTPPSRRPTGTGWPSSAPTATSSVLVPSGSRPSNPPPTQLLANWSKPHRRRRGAGEPSRSRLTARRESEPQRNRSSTSRWRTCGSGPLSGKHFPSPTPARRAQHRRQRYELGGHRVENSRGRQHGVRKGSRTAVHQAARRIVARRAVGELTVKAVPDELGGNPHWPSREEQAAYAAFTLYALHQQSLTTGAHERGVSFGKAVQRLRSTWSEAAVTRRFTAVSTAETIDEVLVHMRGLVSQFRAAQQSLDYVRLAFDLRDLLKPARAASVRLAWGRDFYRTEKDDDNNPAGGITN